MTQKQLSKLKEGTLLIYKGAGLHFECAFQGQRWGSVYVKVIKNIGEAERKLEPGYEASVGTYANLKTKEAEITPNNFTAKNGQRIETKVTHVF